MIVPYINLWQRRYFQLSMVMLICSTLGFLGYLSADAGKTDPTVIAGAESGATNEE